MKEFVEAVKRLCDLLPSGATLPHYYANDELVKVREMLLEQPQLSVWYGSMPESNGKANWTAILYNKSEDGFLGGVADGFTIARSEYPDRVRYDADCIRHLIGELKEKPFILDYDSEKKSMSPALVLQPGQDISSDRFAVTVEQWQPEEPSSENSSEYNAEMDS